MATLAGRPSSSPVQADSSAATSSSGSSRDGARVRRSCRYNSRNDRGHARLARRRGRAPRSRSCSASCATSSRWRPPSRAPRWCSTSARRSRSRTRTSTRATSSRSTSLGTLERRRRRRCATACSAVVHTSTSEVYGTRADRADHRGASARAAVAVRGEQGRRRQADGQLPPLVRPAGQRAAAIQHLRPAPVGARDHPDDHRPGADRARRCASGRCTRAGTSRTSTDTVAGFVAAATQPTRPSGARSSSAPNRDVSIGELVELVGDLLGRELAVETDPRACGRPTARSSACLASPASRASCSDGSRASTCATASRARSSGSNATSGVTASATTSSERTGVCTAWRAVS